MMWFYLLWSSPAVGTDASVLGEGSEVRGQVREGLGWYFTLLKSSTVVSTGGVFQYSSRPNARHRAMAAICNTHTHCIMGYVMFRHHIYCIMSHCLFPKVFLKKPNSQSSIFVAHSQMQMTSRSCTYGRSLWGFIFKYHQKWYRW